MEITITNKLKIYNPTQEVLNLINKHLVVDNPDYLTAKYKTYNDYSTPKFLHLYVKNFENGQIVYETSFGFLSILKENITDFDNIKFNNLLIDNAEQNRSFVGDLNLFDYQLEAVDAMVNSGYGILKAPCGSGKTQIGLGIIQKIGKRALWITHTKDLLKQSLNRAKSYFKDLKYGTITEGQVDIGDDITFATIQTLSKIDPKIYNKLFDCVIVDECHHCVGGVTKTTMFYKVLNTIYSKHKFGLTATTTRADTMIASLYSILGVIRHTIPIQAIGNKVIYSSYNPIYTEITYDFALPAFSLPNGELNNTAIESAVAFNEDRNDIILNMIIKCYNQNATKQLVLCSRVRQCEYLAEELNKRLPYIKTFTRSTIKKDALTEIKKADVIITTLQYAKEGLDIPELDTLHLTCKVKEIGTFEQVAGRIERNYEGKKTPILYEYVDNMRMFYAISKKHQNWYNKRLLS